MHKVLVSVFDNETKAFQGLSALKELHQSGDISLYGTAVIAKEASGTVSVKQQADSGPIGTLVGAVTGALVGAIGGPVGVALGAYVGGMSGLAIDMIEEGHAFDFVDEVGRELTPGRVAVVSDVDEMWTVPIETKLSALGAKTFRRYADDIVDERLSREAEETKADIAQLKKEMSEASAKTKAGIQARMEADERKLESLITRIDNELSRQAAEFEQRMAKLEQQRKTADERRKADIEARVAELKLSHEKRRAKLQQARSLSQEAAKLTKEAIFA